MKFYFCASARGHKKLKEDYLGICGVMEEMGHQNLDDLATTVNPDSFYEGSHGDQIGHYERTIKNVKLSDVVVLELSTHSLSMGYIMQKALESGKSVIALYQGDNYPHFALGIDNDKLQIIEYGKDNLKESLKNALEFAKDQSDIRFNFFISPTIANYFDWIAKNKRIPRSVYLRRLIEADMKANTEYEKVA
ncbi:MAG: hypothetical protein ABFQ62_01825 [Patescibacteria group bacterium]